MYNRLIGGRAFLCVFYICPRRLCTFRRRNERWTRLTHSPYCCVNHESADESRRRGSAFRHFLEQGMSYSASSCVRNDVVLRRFAEAHYFDDDDDDANPKSRFLRYQISAAINVEVAHRNNYSF